MAFVEQLTVPTPHGVHHPQTGFPEVPVAPGGVFKRKRVIKGGALAGDLVGGEGAFVQPEKPAQIIVGDSGTVIVAALFPLSVPLLPFLNLWLPALPALFLIYPGMNANFRIEEKLSGK